MFRRGARSVRACALIFAFLLNSVLAQGAPPDEATQALLNSFRHEGTEYITVVDLDAAKRALDAGANPNYISDSNRRSSVLSHVAYFCSDNASDHPELYAGLLEAIRMLFDRGAHLQYVDGEILFFPLAGGHTEIVRLLLDHGASPETWPHDLGTPLTPIEYATQKGYQDIVGLLVERGVKQIPQEQTLQLKFIEAARRRNTDELKNLLSQGAQINGKNPAEETALLSAIEPFFGSSNDYLAVVFLLDKGADLNLIGKGRTWVTTPLHDLVWIASLLEGKEDSRWANSEKLLRYFLKGGAFVSGSDEREKTPLHIAAERNGVKTAKILLTSGAKVMPRDKSKKTPLDYAQSAEMIALLKEYGAKEH